MKSLQMPLAGALVAAAMLVAPGLVAAAHAQTVAPNPGGSLVVTNSTTATITYAGMPVTQQVNNFATTVSALLNGGQVFTETFAVSFADPTVQAAVVAADAILAGDGASFGAPQLLSNSTVLQSSVTSPTTTYTCQTVPAADATGSQISSVTTFGPGTIKVGTCQSDLFNILAGQTDININNGTQYTVPDGVVTTNTNLTTQVFQIAGTISSPGTIPSPGPTSVPEPGTVGLVLFGWATLVGFRRMRG